MNLSGMFISLTAVFAMCFACGTSLVAQDQTSSQSLEYELALQRGTQAVIWGLPAVSMKGFCGSMKTQLGMKENEDIMVLSQPMVSRHGFLTANNNVPYVAVCLNTKGGPVVLDVPAASKTTMYFGSALDVWQTPVTDIGPAGADKGKGGKYLFLPPGYEGTVSDGYLVFRPNTYTVPVALRPVSLPGGTLEQAVAYARTLRAYALKDADNPPANRYVDPWSKPWNTLPAYDETFFEQLAEVINEEPVLERDLAMMDMLWSIGISKGQPFKPEGEVAKALKQAVRSGYDFLQHQFVTPGGAFKPYGSGTQWLGFNLDKKQVEAGLPFVTEDRLMVDDRATLYFWVTFMPKNLGGGTMYLTGVRDKDGDLLDGKSLYRLKVPKDVPAKNFWSAIAYSMKTKGFIPNTKPVGLSSQDKSLKANADGTYDIYFGPTAPKGMESNWVETGEDWFMLFRLYGPGRSVLDQTWKLNDIEKVYDNLDFQRGVQAVLTALPGASLSAMRRGIREHGPDNQTVVMFEELMDSKTLFLTANTTTIYNFGWLNTKDGPVVLELPPKVLGTVDNFWFHWVGDVGITGPDKGKGGKYLVLPPGYKDSVPDGYFVLRPPTYNMWLFFRGFVVDGSTAPAVASIKKNLRIYPLSKKDNPPAMNIVNGSGKYFNTIHSLDFSFFEEVNEVVQEEPAEASDPETLGLLASIGIEKGKPFEPDERMKKILTEAAAVGNITARALAYKSRIPEAYFYEDSAWCTPFIGGSYQFLKEPGVRNLDARTFFFFYATGITPAMAEKMIGKGSAYAVAFVDAKGDPLDGSKNYKLHLPPNIPEKNFWSFTLYDMQSRSMLQTDQQFPGIGSLTKGLVVNADKSVGIYFGPKPPAGKEHNWMQTMPGKGWSVIFRLYSPLEPWFDKTWRPSEIELVK